MGRTKLTQQLRDRLDSAPDESLVDVVLEIHAGEAPAATADASRQRRIAAARERFLEAILPIEASIHRLGGEVVDRAWLNHTVRARIPVGTLDQLADTEGVVSVDVSAPLTRE